jgi:thiamine transporter
MNGFKEFFSYLFGVDRRNIDLIPDYRVAIIIAAISLLGAALIAGILIKIFKPSWFKKFSLATIAGTGQFMLTYISISVIESIVTPTRNVNTGFNIALIWTTIIFVSILLIVGAAVGYFKPENFETFAKIALGSLLVHSIVIFAGGLGMGQGIGTYRQGYQIAAWITLALVAAAVILILFLQHKKGTKLKKNETLSIAFAGIAIAMSFALSYVRFFRMPTGGSVTFMRFAPLAIYAYIFGVKRGLLAGLVWGTLRLFVDPFIVHPMQFILEYPISSMMVGLAGLARYINFKSPKKLKLNGRLHPAITLAIGLSLVAVVRYTIHVMSGVIWISSFTMNSNTGIPDFSFDTHGFGAILGYSLSVNSVVFVDVLISIIGTVLLMLSPQIQKITMQTRSKFTRQEGQTTVGTEAVFDANGDAPNAESTPNTVFEEKDKE